jgi:hypothetical protein
MPLPLISRAALAAACVGLRPPRGSSLRIWDAHRLGFLRKRPRPRRKQLNRQLLPGPKILHMIRVKSCLLQLEAFWSESVCVLHCGRSALRAGCRTSKHTRREQANPPRSRLLAHESRTHSHTYTYTYTIRGLGVGPDEDEMQLQQLFMSEPATASNRAKWSLGTERLAPTVNSQQPLPCVLGPTYDYICAMTFSNGASNGGSILLSTRRRRRTTRTR